MANPDTAAREAITIVGVIGTFLLFSIFTWAFKRNKKSKGKGNGKGDEVKKDGKSSKGDDDGQNGKNRNDEDSKDRKKDRDDDKKSKDKDGNEDDKSNKEKDKKQIPDTPESTNFDPNKPSDDDSDDDGIPMIPSTIKDPVTSMLNSTFQLAPDFKLGIQNNDETPFKVNFHDTPTTAETPNTSNTQPNGGGWYGGRGGGGGGNSPSGGGGIGGIQTIPQTASIPIEYYNNRQSAGYIPPFIPYDIHTPITPNYNIPTSGIPFLNKTKQPITPIPIKRYSSFVPSLINSESSLSEDEIISPLTPSPIQIRNNELISDLIDPYFFTSAKPTKTSFDSNDLHYDDINLSKNKTNSIDLKTRRLSDLIGIPGLGESLYPSQGDKYNPTMFGDLKNRKGNKIPISPIKVPTNMSPIDLNPVHLTEKDDQEEEKVQTLSPLQPGLSPTKTGEKAKRREKERTKNGRTWDEIKGRYLSPRAVDLPTPLAEETKEARKRRKEIEQDDHERAKGRTSKEREKIPISPERARNKVKKMKKQQVKVVDKKTRRVKTEEILVTDVSDAERERLPERAKGRTKISIRDDVSEGEELYTKDGKKKNREKLRKKIRVDSEDEYISVDEDGRRLKKRNKKKLELSDEEEDERIRRKRKDKLRSGGYYSEEDIENRRKLKPNREKLRHERNRGAISDEEEEELYERYTDKRGQPKLRKLALDDPYVDTYRKRQRVRAGSDQVGGIEEDYEMDKFAQGGQGRLKRRQQVGYQDDIPVQSLPNQQQTYQQQPQLVQADPILAQRKVVEDEILRENPGMSRSEREELAQLPLKKMDNEENNFARKGRKLGANIQPDENDLEENVIEKRKKNRKPAETEVDNDGEVVAFKPTRIRAQRRQSKLKVEDDFLAEEQSQRTRRDVSGGVNDEIMLNAEGEEQVKLKHSVRAEKPAERATRKRDTMVCGKVTDPDFPQGPEEHLQQLHTRRIRKGSSDPLVAADTRSATQEVFIEQSATRHDTENGIDGSSPTLGVKEETATERKAHVLRDDGHVDHEDHDELRHQSRADMPEREGIDIASPKRETKVRRKHKAIEAPISLNNQRRDSLEPIPSPTKLEQGSKERQIGKAEVLDRARGEPEYQRWNRVIEREIASYKIRRNDQVILQEKSMRRWVKRKDSLMQGRNSSEEEDVLRDVVRGIVMKYENKIREDEIELEQLQDASHENSQSQVRQEGKTKPRRERINSDKYAKHMPEQQARDDSYRKARPESVDANREIVDVSELNDEEIAVFEKTGKLPSKHINRDDEPVREKPIRRKQRLALDDKPHRDHEEDDHDRSNQLISIRGDPVPDGDVDFGAPDATMRSKVGKTVPLVLSDGPSIDEDIDERRPLTPTSGKAHIGKFDDDEELYGVKTSSKPKQPVNLTNDSEALPKPRREVVINEKSATRQRRRDSGYESEGGELIVGDKNRPTQSHESLDPKSSQKVSTKQKIGHSQRKDSTDKDLFEHTDGVVPARYRDDRSNDERRVQRRSEGNTSHSGTRADSEQSTSINGTTKDDLDEYDEILSPKYSEDHNRLNPKSPLQHDVNSINYRKNHTIRSEKPSQIRLEREFDVNPKDEITKTREWPLRGENPIRELQRDLQVHTAFVPETRGDNRMIKEIVDDDSEESPKHTKPLVIPSGRKRSVPPKEIRREEGTPLEIGDELEGSDLRTMGHVRRDEKDKRRDQKGKPDVSDEKEDALDIQKDKGISRRKRNKKPASPISPLSPKAHRDILQNLEKNEAIRLKRVQEGKRAFDVSDESEVEEPVVKSSKSRNLKNGNILGSRTKDKDKQIGFEHSSRGKKESEGTDGTGTRSARNGNKKIIDKSSEDEDEDVPAAKRDRKKQDASLQRQARLEDTKDSDHERGLRDDKPRKGQDERKLRHAKTEVENGSQVKSKGGRQGAQRRNLEELKGENPQEDELSSDEDSQEERDGLMRHEARKARQTEKAEKTGRTSDGEGSRQGPRSPTQTLRRTRRDDQGVQDDIITDEEDEDFTEGRNGRHEEQKSRDHTEETDKTEKKSDQEKTGQSSEETFKATNSRKNNSRKVITENDSEYGDNEFREYHVDRISWKPKIHLKASWKILKNSPIWSTFSIIGFFLYVEITRQLFSLLAISSDSLVQSTSSELAKRDATVDDLGFDIKLTNTLFSNIIGTDDFESTSFFVFISLWNIICIPILGYLIYITLESASNPRDKKHSKSWLLWKLRRICQSSIKVILLDKRINGPRKLIKRCTLNTLSRISIFIFQLIGSILVFRQTMSLVYMAGTGSETTFSILPDVAATQKSLLEFAKSLTNGQIFAIVNFISIILLLNLACGWYVLLNSQAKTPLGNARSIFKWLLMSITTASFIICLFYFQDIANYLIKTHSGNTQDGGTIVLLGANIVFLTLVPAMGFVVYHLSKIWDRKFPGGIMKSIEGLMARFRTN
ncbi:uncharacterized protein I206_101895 [Kwoniella pini CBS 10737]|uniref:Uncharacterized protein n=1 Tax=Kwoniella pini CBS 10737 TaxID=1296096 RepID=A0A1B9HVE4_9TREE|nr:uncharacterized protein I206_07014 [Kwoniella pini CBS 10737]OCF47236.1 hypothetical protein I206_07014 [Kwoniella pini CBS 10737]